MNILGFDIGGTKCAVVLAAAFEEHVDFLERLEVETRSDWKSVLTCLVKAAREMLVKFNVNSESCKIGISCGGPLDCSKGLILSPPNLPGWDQVPVVDFLKHELSMPAQLFNDADACALAEWRYGAGRGTQHMVFLTFGTGLGAGLILNGRLYSGAVHMAGEVGHIRIEKDGPTGYGKAGSLEGYCSGGGIRQIAQQKARLEESQGKRVSYQIGSVESITTKDVAMAAKQGKADALEVFRISGSYFGKGLSILIDILNPEVIVVGSIYVRAGEFMREAMEKELKKETLYASYKACRVLPAQLGEQIGDYGAVVAGF